MSLSTFSPRVVGTHRPDFHCLDSVAASPQFAGKRGEQLVLAIYDHFTSTVDGTYHFWPSSETEGNPRVRRSVYDPVKLLNAYGWAICGQCAHTLYGLYTAAGLRARPFGVPGHSLCEVYYDGGWHVLDVDMWTWFRTPAGHIASPAALATNPEALILDNADRSDPCDLPDRKLADYAAMYAQTKVVDGHVKGIGPPWHIRAHAMDFHLRPGETLIRSQDHQGRFHMPQAWVANMDKWRREWKGSPRERYEPFRSFGNGRWIYEPALTADSGDFEAGVWAPSDLARDEAGLVGTGSCTWRIYSPYPFCGIPTVRGDRVTHADGVWLTLAGAGQVRAEVTDPEGEWVEVCSTGAGQDRFDLRTDITGLLTSRYGCLIRVTLGEAAALTRFRFDGYLMTAPLSVPRLTAGENPMEARCGDKHGLGTVPWSHHVDFRAGADLPAQWVSADNARVTPYVDGWQRIAPAEDGPVRVVFRLDAPPARTDGFAWAYAHAGLNEGDPDRPAGMAALEFSADGRTWQDLSRGEISNTAAQYDTSIDGEAVFDARLTSVYFRITSDTAISSAEFHGHLAGSEAAQGPLRIVHRWREGEAEKSFQAPAGATRYVVTCGQGPVGHTIEMHAESI